MDTQPEDVQRLEQELLEQMRAAAKTYRQAIAEHQRVAGEFADMLDHPDGAYAWRTAAAQESRALEEYAQAVKSYSDLVVHGIRPKQ